MSNEITQWSTHCKSWNVLVSKPHSCWSNWVPLLIGVGENSTSILLCDSGLFIWSIWFVIHWESFDLPFSIWVQTVESGSAVTSICTGYFLSLSIDEGVIDCGSREHWIKSTFTKLDLVLSLLEWVNDGLVIDLELLLWASMDLFRLFTLFLLWNLDCTFWVLNYEVCQSLSYKCWCQMSLWTMTIHNTHHPYISKLILSSIYLYLSWTSTRTRRVLCQIRLLIKIVLDKEVRILILLPLSLSIEPCSCLTPIVLDDGIFLWDGACLWRWLDHWS